MDIEKLKLYIAELEKEMFKANNVFQYDLGYLSGLKKALEILQSENKKG